VPYQINMATIYCYKCGRPWGNSRSSLGYQAELKYICDRCSVFPVDQFSLGSSNQQTITTANSNRPPSNQPNLNSMSSNFDKTNHFTDCGIEFPSVTFCGKVFNDIFKHGLSFNQFEDKYKRIAKSKLVLASSFQSSIQYNLQEDIWGPKEGVLIMKKNPGYDACVVYAIRNPGEFGAVDRFLKESNRFNLVQDKPGNRLYSVKIQNDSYLSKREIVLNLLRDTEQSAKVTLMINF
jgi:hypothetical protein